MKPVLSGGSALVEMALNHSTPGASAHHGVPSEAMAQVHPFVPSFTVVVLKPSPMRIMVAFFVMSPGAAVIAFAVNSGSPLGTSAVSSAAMLEAGNARATAARI